jgi:hypothetical protein
MLKYAHIKRCKLEQFYILKCDVYLTYKNAASYKMLYWNSMVIITTYYGKSVVWDSMQALEKLSDLIE